MNSILFSLEQSNPNFWGTQILIKAFNASPSQMITLKLQSLLSQYP